MSRVVIDLEATCWDVDKEKQRRESETIEIGAIYTTDDYQPLGQFQTFIRPVRNPTLTEFCTTLTSIQQADVDRAPTFEDAIRLFGDETERVLGKRLAQIMFCSWGNYDKTQFERDCLFHGVTYPFGVHRNLKDEFSKTMGCKPCGMRRAMERLKIPLVGTHHRGIDDASNITIIARTIWGTTRDDHVRHRRT